MAKSTKAKSTKAMSAAPDRRPSQEQATKAFKRAWRLLGRLERKLGRAQKDVARRRRQLAEATGPDVARRQSQLDAALAREDEIAGLLTELTELIAANAHAQARQTVSDIAHEAALAVKSEAQARTARLAAPAPGSAAIVAPALADPAPADPAPADPGPRRRSPCRPRRPAFEPPPRGPVPPDPPRPRPRPARPFRRMLHCPPRRRARRARPGPARGGPFNPAPKILPSRAAEPGVVAEPLVTAPSPALTAPPEPEPPVLGPGSIAVAGVDVGANSVHLLVAVVTGHRLEPVVDESVFLGLGDRVDAGRNARAGEAVGAGRRIGPLRRHRSSTWRPAHQLCRHGAAPAGRRCGDGGARGWRGHRSPPVCDRFARGSGADPARRHPRPADRQGSRGRRYRRRQQPAGPGRARPRPAIRRATDRGGSPDRRVRPSRSANTGRGQRNAGRGSASDRRNCQRRPVAS